MAKINLKEIADAYEMTIPEYLRGEFSRLQPQIFNLNEQFVFSDITANISATWARNWLSQFNLTGQAWSQDEGGTLLTTQHVAHANHWKIGVGTPIVFYDPAGNPVTRTITSVSRVPNTDSAIGKLNEPVPDTIAVYPVLTEFSDNYDDIVESLYDAPYLMFNHGKKAYVKNIMSVASDITVAKNNPDVPGLMDLCVVIGDSGKPDFIIVEGILVLMSTHTGSIGNSCAVSGPYYGSSINQQGIQGIIEQSN